MRRIEVDLRFPPFHLLCLRFCIGSKDVVRVDFMARPLSLPPTFPFALPNAFPFRWPGLMFPFLRST